MTTPYSTVFDSFLSRIKDWRLDTLYQTSETDFETYLTVFLTSAVIMFNNCGQSLEKTDSTKLFTETLTDENINILGQLMTEVWLEKEVQDVRQMNLHVVDKDFKVHSEAQNLREKNARWSEVRERNSQTLLEYGYNSTDWDSWIAGTFYVSGS